VPLPRVVIVIDIVDADDLVAPLKQRLGGVKTDEPGNSGARIDMRLP
jgi:hypothetical protein